MGTNQYAVFPLTYGQEFSGSNGAGFEIGVLPFTPPFFGQQDVVRILLNSSNNLPSESPVSGTLSFE